MKRSLIKNSPARWRTPKREERERRRRIMRNVPKFYAVRIGRVPGVYNSWSECQDQIVGYPKAKFKSFITHEDALDFVNGGEGDVMLKSIFTAIRQGDAPQMWQGLDGAMEQTQMQHEFSDTNSDAEAVLEEWRPTKKRKRAADSAGDAELDEEIVVASKIPDQTIETGGTTGAERSDSPLGTQNRLSAVEEALARLKRENARLRHRLRVVQQQNASSSTTFSHSTTRAAYSVLLARNTTPPNDTPHRSGPHPEQNMTVLAVYDDLSDATTAAWDAFRKCCDNIQNIKFVDLGFGEDMIDRFKCRPGVCHQRSTSDGELRLYWRDAKGCPGFVCVQRHDVKITRRGSKTQGTQTNSPLPAQEAPMQSSQRHTPTRSLATQTADLQVITDFQTPSATPSTSRSAEGTSTECYIICEHFVRADGTHQDGGILTAYRTRDMANAEAENLFRRRFLHHFDDPIVQVKGILEARPPSHQHGAIKAMHNGKITLVRTHSGGRGRLWVQKLMVKDS